MEKFKIGVVSFTDPRAVKGIAEINRRNLFIPGDISSELEFACRAAGISMEKL